MGTSSVIAASHLHMLRKGRKTLLAVCFDRRAVALEHVCRVQTISRERPCMAVAQIKPTLPSSLLSKVPWL